jgi:hypothetical protein
MLAGMRTISDIDIALKSLPAGLDGTYEAILCRIKDSDCEMAKKILNWLVCSIRPLTATEMADAIAINPNADSWQPELQLFDHGAILEICQGLVVLNSNDQPGTLFGQDLSSLVMPQDQSDAIRNQRDRRP